MSAIFDGTTSSRELNLTTLPFTSFSGNSLAVSLWTYYGGANGWQTAWGFHDDGTSNNYLYFSKTFTGTAWRMTFRDSGGTSNSTAGVGTSNGWDHQVITIGASGTLHYLNNSSNSTSRRNPTGLDEFTIGNNKWDEYYNGRIAHVGIWERELTAAEITALYRGYSPAFFPDGLWSYLPLWDGPTDWVQGNWTEVNSPAYDTTIEPAIIMPAPSPVRFVAAAGGPVDFQPGAGTLTLTGQAPTATFTFDFTPSTGVSAFTGYVPTVSIPTGTNFDVPAGTAALTGYAPICSCSTGLEAPRWEVVHRTAQFPSGAVSITGLSFTPTACIVIHHHGGGSTTGADISIGFADGSSQWVCSMSSQHGVGTTNTDRVHEAGEVAYDTFSDWGLTSTGPGTNKWDYFSSGVNDDDATFIFTNDPDVKVGNFTMGANVNDTATVSSLGFTPRAIFFVSADNSNAPPNKTTDAALSFGCAIKPDASITQRSMSYYDDNGRLTTVVESYIASDRAVLQHISGLGWTGEVTTMDDASSGRFIITTRNASSGSDYVGYLALGAAVDNLSLSTVDSPTSAGTWSVSTIGFQPQIAILAGGMNTAVDTSGTADPQSVFFAAATDGTNSSSASYDSRDDVGTSDTHAGSKASFPYVLDWGANVLFDIATPTFDMEGWDGTITGTPDGTTRKWWVYAANTPKKIFKPGVGSLTLTGAAPAVAFTFDFAPGTGVLAFTGYTPTADIQGAINLLPGVGALALTGQAPGIAFTFDFAPGLGTLNLTGQAPAVTSKLDFAPGLGALTLTGQAPTVSTQSAIDIPAGALALTGQAPAVTFALDFAPGVGALALTGYAPAITEQGVIDVPAGALAFTGYAPALTEQGVIDVPAGALTLAGQAPSVTFALDFAPTLGALTLTGAAPTVSSQAAMNIPAGALALTGQAPAVTFALDFAPGVGALTLTGQAPSASVGTNIGVPAGALAFTGQAPAVTFAFDYAPGVGALTLTGQAPAAGLGETITPAAGALAFTGQAPTVAFTLDYAPGLGALALTGQAPSVVSTTNAYFPGVGALALTGASPALAFDLRFTPPDSCKMLVGYAPTLILGFAPHKVWGSNEVTSMRR